MKTVLGALGATVGALAVVGGVALLDLAPPPVGLAWGVMAAGVVVAVVCVVVVHRDIDRTSPARPAPTPDTRTATRAKGHTDLAPLSTVVDGVFDLLT